MVPSPSAMAPEECSRGTRRIRVEHVPFAKCLAASTVKCRWVHRVVAPLQQARSLGDDRHDAAKPGSSVHRAEPEAYLPEEFGEALRHFVGELLKENTGRHGQSLAQALPGFNLGRASCSSLLHLKWNIGVVKGPVEERAARPACCATWPKYLM
jgi:hypothetical protein